MNLKVILDLANNGFLFFILSQAEWRKDLQIIIKIAWHGYACRRASTLPYKARDGHWYVGKAKVRLRIREHKSVVVEFDTSVDFPSQI